jgi:hypothetical protein
VKEPIIVGYDPGTTAALAIIDTRGKILFLKSKRGFKRGEIIDIITDMGKPLLVAGDRRPLPKSVEKMSRSLGCRPFYPKKSLSISDKNWIVRSFMKEIKDEHEKDALASALNAFKYYSKVFKRTHEILESRGLINLYGKIVEAIITGEVENITGAINKMLSAEAKLPETNKKTVDERGPLNKTVSELQERIKRLERDIEILKGSNEKFKNELKMSEKNLTYYRKKAEGKIDMSSLQAMKKNIDSLRHELKHYIDLAETLRFFRKVELEDYYPIIEFEEIRDNVAKDIDKNLDLKDRVILTEKVENAQVLNDYKIKALIVSNEPNESMTNKVDFPIILKKDISLEKVKNISVVKKWEMEECIKKSRKTGLVQLLQDYRKRKL